MGGHSSKDCNPLVVRYQDLPSSLRLRIPDTSQHRAPLARTSSPTCSSATGRSLQEEPALAILTLAGVNVTRMPPPSHLDSSQCQTPARNRCCSNNTLCMKQRNYALKCKCSNSRSKKIGRDSTKC